HGNLHYTGRTDTQIKIRGFRIEPTEIENTLTTHPHITQATTTHTNNQLTAHITTTPNTTTTPHDIRTYLRQHLPQHMIPTHITTHHQLPLTPNGKIDKQALLALPKPRPETAGAAGRPPRTALERTVCAAFGEALGTDVPPGPDDDFFALGGHSLVAAKLANRLSRALELKLTLRDVFRHQTPARLAAYLETGPADTTTAPEPRRARPVLRRRTDQERITS
ncbi:phosphopantetheine-binding protein, partial [Streptomyces sp. NPDC059256]